MDEVSSIMADYEHFLRNRKHLAASSITTRLSVLRTTEARLNAVGSSLKNASTSDLELALEDRSERELSASSKADYISHLHSFYEWLVTERAREENPARAMVKPRKPKRLPRPLTEQELERAIRTAGFRRPLRTWLLLGAYSGLRVAEIASLRAENINLEEGWLTVVGKGDKERRIPLHDKVAAELAIVKVIDVGPLFPGRTNETVGPKTVGKLIAEHLRAQGIDKSAHKLRHRFGTRVYQQTGDILITSELLGHSSLEVTKVYAAWNDSQARKAIASI